MRCPKCDRDFTHHRGILGTRCPSCGYQFETPVVVLAANSAKSLFEVTLTGDRHFLVRFEETNIAEVEVWIEGKESVLVVEPLVFGELRPKIDSLFKCFNDLTIPNLNIVKVRV